MECTNLSTFRFYNASYKTALLENQLALGYASAARVSPGIFQVVLLLVPLLQGLGRR